MKLTYILLILLAVNVFSFLLFGIDKQKAKKNHWRISESALLLSAFAMGGAGALLGMKLWRHKTKKIKFKILVPVALVCNIGVLFYLFCYLKWPIFL